MGVRRARAEDVPQLLVLVRRYREFEGIGGFEALRMELLLQELIVRPGERGWVVVAEAQGALTGYLVMVLMMSLEHQGLMAEIDEFFVLPEARGGGTGTQLLARAEAELRQRGCVRLQLQLASRNTRARSFYERHGFAARAGYGLLDKALK
ncbi:MAG TPA: GNAT family N-acetyltransferase [Steroidobacteraceae bacterium]|nr:GNAT family N-acetyltransferase [Steroidobacteraceae bacterium]